MSLNLSTKDINFFQKFCVLTNCFLITSWYDFQHHSLLWPTISKLYAFSLCLFKITVTYFSVHHFLQYSIFQKLFTSQKFFIISFQTISLLQSLFQIIASVFLYQNKWKTMIINFEYIDGKLENQDKKENKIFKNFYFKLFLKHLLFAVLFAPYLYFWLSVSENYDFFVIINGFELYNHFLLVVFLYSLVRCFEIRYKELGKYLIFICKNSKNLASDLRRIQKVSRILAENIDLYNETFGNFLLIIIVHCGLHIVHCANFIFVNVSFEDRHFEIHAAVFNTVVITFLSVIMFLF